MGRANPNRPTSTQQQQQGLLPTSEYDPAHTTNLRRSLNRNDVELAALSKLHGQIRLLKGTILREFGEEALLECVLNEKKAKSSLLKSMEGVAGSGSSGDTIEIEDSESNHHAAEHSPPSSPDCNTAHTHNHRLHSLTTAFLLRMKLRRRLLNRLARRLHRVAHSMDILTSNNVNKNVISAPFPPRYGDVVRRYLSMEAEESGSSGGGSSVSTSNKMMMIMGNSMENVKVIREKDLIEFVKAEEGKKKAEELLMKQRRERGDGGGDGRGIVNIPCPSSKTNAIQIVEENVEEEEARDEEPMDVDEDRDTILKSTEDENSKVKEERPEKQDPTNNTNSERTNSKSEVDLLLQCDEEDKSYLDKIVEYEPGYDKLYTMEKMSASNLSTTISPTPTTAEVAETADVSGFVNPIKVEQTETKNPIIKMTMPIVSTIDDHEVNDEGLPIMGRMTTAASKQQQQHPTRLPFTLAGSTPSSLRNGPNPKEIAEEWKRWTTELLDKIPDQITFDELGVGGSGVVFDLEGRLMTKKKRKERGEEDRDTDGENIGDGEDEDAAVTNQGKGKVLKKNKSEKETDTTTKDDSVEAEKGNAKAQECKTSATHDSPKTTKSFSVLPVPSFHYLDLKRIRNLQNEMVKCLQVQRSREGVIKAQAQYDAAYNRSIELQQAKSAVIVELNKVMEESRAEELSVSKSRDMLYGPALHHWKKRQFQLQDMELKFGKDQSLNRDVSNDVIQDMKDRVCIRVSEELTGTGLGTLRLRTEELKSRSEGNLHREVSATMLGHIIDTVDRRYNDMLANHSEFVPPPLLTLDSVIVDHETGETMAQSHARKVGHLRLKITQFDSLFKEAEKKRCERWTTLTKAKGAGVAPSNNATANSNTVIKPKPRSRKSTSAIVPGGSGTSFVSSNSRMSYPMQVQAHVQPIAPGYGPAYYDPQRAVMASQQQMQARMLMQQQQLKQQQHTQQIAHMQSMLMQQQEQQIQERAATGVSGVQYQSIPTNVVPQMRMAQYPQPNTTASSAPAPASPIRNTLGEAVGVRNQPRVKQQQGQEPEESSEEALLQHRTSLSKYGYGDRYSQSNVNARKKHDGTVIPVSAPKLMPDGTFARPAGRQRKGMEWDAIKGCWYPLAGWQQPSSWSGDDE